MVESTAPKSKKAALNTHNLGVIEDEIVPSKWRLMQQSTPNIADLPLYSTPEKEDLMIFKHVSLRIIDLFYEDEPR
jgi:hypothetical protein